MSATRADADPEVQVEQLYLEQALAHGREGRERAESLAGGLRPPDGRGRPLRRHMAHSVERPRQKGLGTGEDEEQDERVDGWLPSPADQIERPGGAVDEPVQRGPQPDHVGDDGRR